MFYKYEFESEKQADELIGKLAKSKTRALAVVKLGFLTITPETFTKGGKGRGDAVISKKFSVDVMFVNKDPLHWQPYRITLGKNPSSHNFAGVSYSEPDLIGTQ